MKRLMALVGVAFFLSSSMAMGAGNPKCEGQCASSYTTYIGAMCQPNQPLKDCQAAYSQKYGAFIQRWIQVCDNDDPGMARPI